MHFGGDVRGPNDDPGPRLRYFDECRGVIPLLVVQSLLGLLMDTVCLGLRN